MDPNPLYLCNRASDAGNVSGDVPLNNDEKKILAVTCLGHFMAHFNMLTFPVLVLPLSTGLDMSVADVLGLSFAMYLLFGLTALPWGLAADRWGAKPLLVLYFSGAGLCALSAAYHIDSPAGLTVSLAGLGLFSGIYHPAGLGLISKGVRQLSLGMGYNGMSGNLGLAMAPVLAGLLNWLWGPGQAYVAVAVLNLVGLILLLVFRVSEGEAVVSDRPEDGQARVRPFVLLLIAMMLGGLTYRGATVILPTYLEVKSPGIVQMVGSLWPAGQSGSLVAATLTSFIFFIGILGQYAGGHTGNRFDPRYGYLIFHAIALPAVLAMSFTQDFALLGVGMVYLFFLLGMQPLENTLVARLTPHRFRHSAYGAKFILTFGVGSLAVKLVGLIQSHFGYSAVFLVLAGFTVLLLAAILGLILRTGPIKP